jgi:hypothetical protein
MIDWEGGGRDGRGGVGSGGVELAAMRGTSAVARRIVPGMSTGTGSEPSGGPRADGAHLDEDADCLEDPVHCGDARHQHDWHALSTGKKAAASAAETTGTPESAGEPAQA